MTARTFWILESIALMTMLYGSYTFDRPVSLLGLALALLPAFAVVKQSEVK